MSKVCPFEAKRWAGMSLRNSSRIVRQRKAKHGAEMSTHVQSCAKKMAWKILRESIWVDISEL